MTADEYQHWLAHVYGKESQRRLLIVDSYKPHQTEDSIKKVKDSCNSDVIIIPGGCTSIVQPMDRCINRPFKEYMRASWQEWMRPDRAKTKKGNLTPAYKPPLWFLLMLRLQKGGGIIAGLYGTCI